MALAFSASNLLQFYTFISPIFISLFLLLKSTMEYNMKGIVYILGVLINYVIGMLIKTIGPNMVPFSIIIILKLNYSQYCTPFKSGSWHL